MKAANVIYEVEEGRKFWKLKPLQLLVTLIIMLLTTLIVLCDRGVRPVAQRVGDIIGARRRRGDGVQHHQVAGSLLIVSQIFAFLFYVGPNVKQRASGGSAPARRPGRRPVDHRVGRVRVLRRELRLLQQDLRQHGRR